MNRSIVKTLVLVFAGVLLLQSTALAGPPLLCHPFNIGDARSLPFQGPDWSRVDASYDVKHLLDDTAALLNADIPVIVRMETLRRATLYARNDAKLASPLLELVNSRAAKFDTNSHDHAAILANFDMAYLAETYRQAARVSAYGESHWAFQQMTPKIDGYAMIEQLIAQGGGPEMEFAAAVVASDHPGSNYRDHIQRALASAKPGTLLARNLAAHFP